MVLRLMRRHLTSSCYMFPYEPEPKYLTVPCEANFSTGQKFLRRGVNAAYVYSCRICPLQFFTIFKLQNNKKIPAGDGTKICEQAKKRAGGGGGRGRGFSPTLSSSLFFTRRSLNLPLAPLSERLEQANMLQGNPPLVCKQGCLPFNLHKPPKWKSFA